MLSQVLGGLTLVRHAVAITLVMGAAGATVAGAVDTSHASTVTTNTVVSTTANTTQNDTKDLEAAVKACLGTKDPASDECAAAIDLSGLSADEFWAKVALSLNEQLGRAKNTNTRELIGLVTACVASHERSSEPCAKALALSGLSADEFWAKVGGMFENKKHEPTASPKTTEKPKTTNGDAAALIKECVAAYERARQTHESGEAVSQICNKAIAASGLSANDFWAKYYPKPATSEQPKPTVTRKPQPTQRVSDADLAALVKDCFAKYTAAAAAKGNEDLAHAAYDACTKAMAASGLTGDAFWAKFGKPTASN